MGRIVQVLEGVNAHPGCVYCISMEKDSSDIRILQDIVYREQSLQGLPKYFTQPHREIAAEGYPTHLGRGL